MRLEPPPHDERELLARAHALAGRSLGSIAGALGAEIPAAALHAKGKLGTLLEAALGARPAAGKSHDFPDLGIELKTIPVDERGVPRESTYVAALRLADADELEWASSWVRAKLSRVLFVPLETASGAPWHERLVGAPVLWSPTAEQEAILRADFDDAVGLVAIGRVEELTAHMGRWLQVRPKARDGRARTRAYGRDGEWLEANPRGFYLRPHFTGALLLDPAAVPR